MPPLEGKNGYSKRLSGAFLGGRTDIGICSNSHPLGFTRHLSAATRAAHVRGTGGLVRVPRCICIMLTIKELSAWLNIKPSTLYLWVSQKKIPCCRIHGLIRFDSDAIQAWLNGFGVIPGKQPSFPARHDSRGLDQLIEAAKREVYTPRHGETIAPSPREKEEQHGAR